jgi:ribosomal protein L11 methylase PrmA
MEAPPLVEAGSYRDPAGAVYDAGSEIYRTVTSLGIADFDEVWATGYLQSLVEKGWLVPVERLDTTTPPGVPDARAVLRHPRLSFISYPYEWSFEALKSAALLHLDIQLDALAHDIALIDASAYNIQFIGPRPVFIDHLSFRPYHEGKLWIGHRQFLEQFLNPLLLRSILGVPHNAWFRGNLEGIATAELARLIPWPSKLSFNVLSHVVLPAYLQGTAPRTDKAVQSIRQGRLPRASYLGILHRLRGWIAGLSPKRAGRTTWQRYEDFHSYGVAELEAKRAFVRDFAARVKPRQLWDLGCNTGEFSELALEAGAAEVIGFDFDQGALDGAFERARDKGLRFLPLYLDAANPSPGQGWAGTERKSLAGRCRADAVLALAFVHHLAIGRNLPLAKVADWLTTLAPEGVVEFVPKTDPRVRLMLQLREDVFPTYTEKAFLEALASRARIVKKDKVGASDRLLIRYERA